MKQPPGAQATVGVALLNLSQGVWGDRCRIKFGAVRPGPSAAQHFDGLLDACEAFAISRGMTRLSAGTNLAREDFYIRMKVKGFRTDSQAVAMQRFNEPSYNRPDVYAIDDWR